ncbi:unnamed protein product [Dovyalis caffra]|uniref:Uncharacterized protein n=1 Tax=Dovyalis caffra TaxID=77055 RepID=A0AAV1S9V4_9ROSI|nr:unnamed protein product [Dovyalis caffra]
MDYWTGVFKIPSAPTSTSYCRVAVSLCLSTASKTLAVPAANAIFFNGDRVEGTKDPVIERLSDLQKIAEILVSKFGGCVNAYVIEAPVFNGPFAVYKDFIPSVNRYGEPKSYNPVGMPASNSTVTVLLNCLKEAKKVISRREQEPLCNNVSASSFNRPKTYILGFSKGGTVLNQLVAELGSLEVQSHMKPQPASGEFSNVQEEIQIIPIAKEGLLNSISEIHYVDVGLNSPGAYITNHDVIERISKRLMQGALGIRFVLHGTPRQWCDSNRVLIRNEKDKLLHLLVSEARTSGGKLQVCEKFYFGDRPPDLQMHFEIIENIDVC